MISCNITLRSEWIDNWADYLNWPHLQKLQKLISMRKLRRSISNHWGFSNIRSSRSGNKRNHSTLGFTILPLLHNAHILHLVDVNGFIFQVVFPKHTITDYAFKFKSIQLLTTLSNSKAYFHWNAQIYNFWVFIEHFCHPVSKNRPNLTDLILVKILSDRPCTRKLLLSSIRMIAVIQWWYHYYHNQGRSDMMIPLLSQ